MPGASCCSTQGQSPQAAAASCGINVMSAGRRQGQAQSCTYAAAPPSHSHLRSLLVRAGGRPKRGQPASRAEPPKQPTVYTSNAHSHTQVAPATSEQEQSNTGPAPRAEPPELATAPCERVAVWNNPHGGKQKTAAVRNKFRHNVNDNQQNSQSNSNKIWATG